MEVSELLGGIGWKGEIVECQDVCEKHGKFTNYSMINGVWSGCEKCMIEKDNAKRQAQFAEEEVERKAREWQARLGRAAIPERFADRTLCSYKPTSANAQAALQDCMDFAADFENVLKIGKSLILCGGVGTGKTHLAVGIGHSIIRQHKQPLFVSVGRAIRKIKETYGKDKEQTEDQAISSFIQPDLLILDEVGVQFGSETEKMYLFEIINGRYEKLKPTILISNLSLEDLKKFIGDRAMDRLREGGGKAIVFDWPSYRKNA